MKVVPACTPCVLRRVLATAERITDDPWLHEKVLAQAMGELTGAERDITPAERITRLHDLVCKNLGVTDPWQKARESWLEEMETLAEPLRQRIEADPDPLAAALRTAARANVFDDEILTRRKVREDLKRLGLRETDEPTDVFVHSDLDRFRSELAEAETLMFIHDSAPELVFDRVLLEKLRAERPGLRITCVVRPQPVILDAIRADFETAQVDRVEGVEAIVDPGTTGLGISLESVGKDFRERFEESDLVIAKGQAHLETLSDADRAAYFLFRIKCSVMARQQGSRVGEIAFVRG